MAVAAPSTPGPPANQEKSFAAALEIVKLFTTLSSGALAFSIGLTSQSTTNYPGALRIAIIVGWLIFFAAIVCGVWAQALAPRLIRDNNPDPNDASFRGSAFFCLLFFLVGVAVLGIVLMLTAPLGPAGERIAIESPMQALDKAETVVKPVHIAKIDVIEYLRGVDLANPDQAVWHVQLDLKAPTAARTQPNSSTVDIYVHPVTGCASAVQKPYASVPKARGCR